MNLPFILTGSTNWSCVRRSVSALGAITLKNENPISPNYKILLFYAWTSTHPLPSVRIFNCYSNESLTILLEPEESTYQAIQYNVIEMNIKPSTGRGSFSSAFSSYYHIVFVKHTRVWINLNWKWPNFSVISE